MKHLFVVKDVVYASKIGGGVIASAAEMNQLAAGAIAFFTEANALITTANVAAYTGSRCWLAVGSGDVTKGARISIMIDRAVKQKTKTAYVAPVLQRSFIGNNGTTGALNLPATLIPGTTADIVIVDTLAPVNNTIEATKYRYQHVVTISDTANTIITSLIAQINADPDAIVDATVVGSQVGIQLDDNRSSGGTFSIGVSEILADATITADGTNNSLNFKPGNGTPAHITKVETETASHEGKTNGIWYANLYYNVPTEVVVGATYDVYDFKWNQDNYNSINASVATTQHIIVAFTAGAATAGQASFDTIIATLFTNSSAI